MSAKPFLGLLLAAAAVIPALAQTASSTENPGGNPGTTALNQQVAAATTANADAAVVTDAATQAQYDADRAAYMDALIRHDTAVDRTDARYMRQQGAYADAMRVWRAQVYACKHGHPKACNLPTPDPAAFY